MVSRKKKTWVYSSPRKPKPKVPDEIKQALQEKADEIVEKIFKSEYLEAVPEQLTINHLVDFHTKWYRNYFYFCSKYKCPSEAYSSFFESKFARIEYIGNNKFKLSYMRHTGQWGQLETGSMDDCLKSISTMVPH